MHIRRHFAFLCIALAAIGVFAYARQEGPAPSAPAAAPAAAERASLIVGEASYPLAVSAGGTLIGAMNALASSSGFAFTGREYPGLGFFVDSINGRANAGGKYWILYVNGVSSPVGASEAPVRAGDVFEWRYEKGY